MPLIVAIGLKKAAFYKSINTVVYSEVITIHKNNLKIRLDDDNTRNKALAFFVAVVLWFNFLTNISSGISELTGLSVRSVTLTIRWISLITFFCILPFVFTRLKTRVVIFTAICAFVFLFNYLVFTDLNEYLSKEAFLFFSLGFTTFVALFSIDDYKYVLRFLTVSSHIITAVVLLLVLLVNLGRISTFIATDESVPYSMGFGYACLIPSMLLFYDFFKTKRVINIIEIGVLLFAIIIYASRGPLMGFALFAVFYLVRYFLNKRQYIRCILIVLSIILFVLFYKTIFIWFFGLFEDSFISTSHLKHTLESDDFVYLSSRNSIYDILIQEVFEHPFYVRGINAEWPVVGVYAHNIVLELIYQFGIVFGGAFVCLILYRVVRTVILKGENDLEILCIVLMFACIPQLMVSNSLWRNYVFWAWMAAIAKYLQEYRLQKNQA